jgi:hypothetical protein
MNFRDKGCLMMRVFQICYINPPPAVKMHKIDGNNIRNFTIGNINRQKKGFYPKTVVRKLLIRATNELASRLEEKLRYNYDVRVHVLDDITIGVVCEILAEVQRKWVTICRFAHTENLEDILTMFRVNFELKTKRP